jgi:site-specific recombinase XerD
MIPAVTRAHIGAYLASMQSERTAISNATVQQRITVLRLFYGHLVDEGLCSKNPVVPDSGRILVRRYRRLPWIPNDADWQAILAATCGQPIRNRTMLAFAYDAALRQEELCGLRTDDIDPSARMFRIRAETTKGRRDRVVPYSATTALCSNSIFFIEKFCPEAEGHFFSRSPAATTPHQSRSGHGRRSSSRSPDVPTFGGSQPIHSGTFA